MTATEPIVHRELTDQSVSARLRWLEQVHSTARRARIRAHSVCMACARVTRGVSVRLVLNIDAQKYPIRTI